MKMFRLLPVLCLLLVSCGAASSLDRPGSGAASPSAVVTATQLPVVVEMETATATTLQTPVLPETTATQPERSVTSQGLSPELAFPIRAAFYYPWFPESWDQAGVNPFTHYQPSLGFYNQDQAAVIQTQIAAMQYGQIQLGIASWWGQGHYTDKRIPELLLDGERVGFHWSLYVESEGIGDPSVDAIRADLGYIRDNYASSPAYLKIDGRFVVFVYADGNDRCGMADRWKQANNTVGAYLVLKIFPGYKWCASQPDAWHEYAPATDQRQVGQTSFTISPGFWKASEPQPKLGRDLARWDKDIQAMIASKANFQLITTFNEWGEGTAVESAQNWKSPSGFGPYLDALHRDGQPASP